VGTSVVGIFGPTNSKVTGPSGMKSTVCRLNLSCSPCYDTGFSENCPHGFCLKGLSPDSVSKVVSSFLTGTARPKNCDFEPGSLPKYWTEFLHQRESAQIRFEKTKKWTEA
jgi:hypothetical protein